MATKKKTTAKKKTVKATPKKKTTAKSAPKKTVKKKATAKKTTTKKKSTAKSAPKKKSKKETRIAITQEQRHKMICDAAYYISLNKTFDTVDPYKDWLEAEAAIDKIYVLKK